MGAFLSGVKGSALLMLHGLGAEMVRLELLVQVRTTLFTTKDNHT